MAVETTAGPLWEQGGLATTFACMTPAEARVIAWKYFGIEGAAHRFDTEKDDTFRIDCATGKQYVLKAANPDETEAEIDLQLSALEHIADHDPDFPAPRVCRSQRDGRVVTHVDAHGQRRYVRMLTYLPGQPLADTSSNAAQREQVGETLARLRLALSDFSHPLAHRPLAWDVKHLPELAPLSDHIDPEHRAMIHQGLERYTDIQGQLVGLPAQVLHNDFSLSNIVVDHVQPRFVTGIIDFGDIVHTLIAIDVSTALLNQLPRRYEADLFSAGRDVLRGYLRVAGLSDEELAVIPHLVMARVIARALITTWRATHSPDNARYILRNTEPGWAQLRWFLERSADDVSAVLLPIRAVGAICGA